MTNVKISAKGRALLSNRNAARKVATAIALRGGELASRDGLTVEVDGKSIKLRAAPQKIDK